MINKALFLSILTVGVGVFMQFVFIRYASYYINRVDYGNFVLLQTLIAALSGILLQIPNQAFDRFYNQGKNKLEFINEFRSMLIIIDVISVLFIIVYGFIMKKFSVFILFLIFLNFILLNNFALNQKIFLLDLERKKYFCLKILESSAKYIFPVIIYSYFRTLESLLCGIVFGYGIAYIVLIYFLRNMKFYFLIKIKNIKKYISFAYPIIFVSIFTWGISFSDRYFVEYYRGTKEVAIYSLLAMVAGIGSIIGRVYFMYAEPKILKNYEKNSNETFQMLNRYLKFLIGVFLSLFLFAYFIPKEIYSILLEKDLVNNTYYFNTMMILLVATFVNILHIAHHMYLKLLHKLNILAYILFIAFIVNLFGNFFIKKYGILVGAVSTLTAYCVILILQVIYVNIYLKKYDV